MKMLTQKQIKARHDNFIKQTAKDYDLEVWEVERIYRKYPLVEFYMQLELLVENYPDPAYEPKPKKP